MSKNIILIGMPGSGKTTVGKALADRLGMTFADTDAMITDEVGITPAELINRHGEAYFRRIETDAAKKAAGYKNAVISTGGGIVTVAESIEPLKSSGVVVFIERDISELVTSGRPISLDEGVESLFARREPLYRKYADITVKNTGITVDGVVDEIISKREIKSV